MGTTTTKRRVGEEMMMMRWTIMIVTLVVVAMYTQVARAGDGTTDVIDSLNGLIAATPSSATYRGGSNYGVLHRAEDGYSFDTSKKVVPAAFIHNDAVAPTSTYPCGNPHCIRTTGSDGIFSENICNYDSYMNAALGWVIGDEGSLKNLLYDLDNIQTDTWGWGVFYATDSNASDQRCVHRDDWKPSGFDCPGYFVSEDGTVTPDSGKCGAGCYDAGNPYVPNKSGGGGAGCHFSSDGGRYSINQWNARDSNGQNLVGGKQCQCNYNLKGGNNFAWEDWTDVFISGDASWYPDNLGLAQGVTILSGSGNGGPQYLADYAACWVNNPTDMIDLANALYFRRAEWLNGQYPDSAAQGTVQEERRYPGWTEVPVENTSVKNQDNWTTMGIRLPANVCNDSDGSKTSGSITLINDCLDSTAKVNLECQITDYVELGYIKPGSDNITKRPGSYVTIIKDYQVQDSTRPGQFERKFYCENWVSPNQYWQIVYVAKDDPNGNGKGACYIEFGPAWQGGAISSSNDLLCGPNNAVGQRKGGKPGCACAVGPDAQNQCYL